MSEFLPENFSQMDAQTGVASIAPATPEVTQGDIALMQRVLAAAAKSPNLIPSDFMAYMFDWIQTQRLNIPISQVFGFSQFTAQPADNVDTSESTSSTAYADLATVGPKLDGLSGGRYVILFGAAHTSNPNAATQYMSIQINSTAAIDSDAGETQTSGGNAGGTTRAVLKTLTDGANTITAKYKTTSGTATFQYRWMFALRYANA